MCWLKALFLVTTTVHLSLISKHVESFNPDACLNLTDNSYINIQYCGTYYRCTAGTTELFYCPWGRMFDPVINRCVIGARCQVTCPAQLPVPFKATLIYPPTLRPFTVANYSCSPGYRLVGNSSRTCGPDGVWQGLQPTCVRAASGAPKPMHGTIISFGHGFAGKTIVLHDAISSPTLCADLCRSNTGCKAANFHKVHLRCELFSTKPVNYSSLQVTPSRYDFIELLN